MNHAGPFRKNIQHFVNGIHPVQKRESVQILNFQSVDQVIVDGAVDTDLCAGQNGKADLLAFVPGGFVAPEPPVDNLFVGFTERSSTALSKVIIPVLTSFV